MIQFTSEEVDKLRKKSKAYPLSIEKLKRALLLLSRLFCSASI